MTSHLPLETMETIRTRSVNPGNGNARLSALMIANFRRGRGNATEQNNALPIFLGKREGTIYLFVV